MDFETAKLILQSYRPGGQDAGDPHFAEALALVKSEPGLAAWFAQQQKYDAWVSGKIKSLAAPADLKAKILSRENPLRQKTLELPAPAWWRSLFSFSSPVAWTMAAVLLILGFAVFWKESGNRAPFAEYSARMVYAAEHDANHVEIENKDLKQVMTWLAEHHGENKFVLPVALNGDNGLMGCRVLDWHGQKVSMLCYGLSGSSHVDLFVAAANAFPDAPPEDQPQFVSSGGLPTASWSHDGKAYLLVSHGDGTILEKILRPTTALKTRRFGSVYFAQAGIFNFNKNYLE
jgi:anti-sigma factor RsiW